MLYYRSILFDDFRLSVRMSLRELDQEQNSKKRHDFLKAWKIIQELPPSNPNSFYSIATYHGMPFKDRVVEPKTTDGTTEYFWGGYCQHGNVLFPTWHRFYLLRLEQALQTAVPGVALHYWDETTTVSLDQGLPSIVLQEKVTIDGEEVNNPLRNFTLPVPLTGDADSYYLKSEAGYTTKRYPYSGIINPAEAKQKSIEHNITIDGMDDSPETLLQTNVKHWLNKGSPNLSSDSPNLNSVANEFELCLNQCNYNDFSNTTSSTQSLEQPHNDVHLSIGGFYLPEIDANGEVVIDPDTKEPVYNQSGILEGANGDMGANEVASYDPVFYLHHANIDRMFWVWQKKWYKTDSFTITQEGAGSGTVAVGNDEHRQGLTPNQGEGQELTMQTVLYPFQDQFGVPRTSNDCVNIETQLGYTYSIGSLDQEVWDPPASSEEDVVSENFHSWDQIFKTLKKEVHRLKNSPVPIRAIFNRATERQEIAASSSNLPSVRGGKQFSFDNRKWMPNNIITVKNLERNLGSFVVQAFHKLNGKLYFVGQRGVLDRWDRSKCENCKKHPFASVGFLVNGIVENKVDMDNLMIQVVYKDPRTAQTITKKIFEPKPTGVRNVAARRETVDFYTEIRELL